MNQREQFEAAFPLPEGIHWNPDRAWHVPVDGSGRLGTVAREWDVRWQTWQAARKAPIVSAFSFEVIRPGCDCSTFVSLRSMDLKICADCGQEHPWTLAPGQPPLIGNNRADRRAIE